MFNKANLNNGSSFHPAELDWFAHAGLIHEQRQKFMIERGLISEASEAQIKEEA